MEAAAGAIGFCALVLNVIPLISTSDQSSTMKSLNWVHTKEADISYYGVSVSFSGQNFKIGWSDTECPYALTSSVCKSCEDAFKVSLAFVVICLAFNAIGIIAATLATKNKSSSTWRIGGAVAAFLAMVSGIITIVVFSVDCEAKIKDKVGNQTLTYGPSWILMLVVLLLKFIEIVIWIAASTMASKVATTN